MRRNEKAGTWAICVSIILGAVLLVPVGVVRGGISVPCSNQGYERVRLDTGSVYYQFYVDASAGLKMQHVDCQASHDNGVSWSHPIRVSNVMWGVERISVAAYGSYLYAAWEDATSRSFKTFMSYSGDSGATWSVPLEMGGDHPSVSASVSGFIVTSTLGDGAIAVASGNHGEMPIIVNLATGLAPLEAASGYRDGVPMVAFVGGFKNRLTGEMAELGIYYTALCYGTWQTPT